MATKTSPDSPSKRDSSHERLSEITRTTTKDDEFNEDEDILEFHIGMNDDPSILRSYRPPDEDYQTPTVIHRKNLGDTTTIRTDVPIQGAHTTTIVHQGEHAHKDGPQQKVHQEHPSESSHQAALTGEFQDLQTIQAHVQSSNQPGDDASEEWQDMKTVGSYEVYDDKGKLIVHRSLEDVEEDGEEQDNSRHALASKGYTRVTGDEDARSITSMDEKADFLFENDEDDDARDLLSQLQATKQMLTDAQRIAYVGMCRLVMVSMAKQLAHLKGGRKATKALSIARDSHTMWSQKMMIRLYTHMDIAPEEQIMIEQLPEHGVLPSDLSPSLKQSSKVSNPLAEEQSSTAGTPSRDATPTPNPIDTEDPEQVPTDMDLQRPDDIKGQKTIDIDVRWTLLCDLFLVLISDSVYDARSRTLLRMAAEHLGISWLEVCQFESKVTDALEIEEGSVQTWNEKEIMEHRRKKGLKKKYMYVGLATLGGGLVLGLSAGLLAPVIGAGLAAGFTTVGVTGTSGFLAGAGGAAVVTTAGTAIGARVGSKGMAHRMGHVRTFEYRPLHNNKRVNAIVTVSGWMLGREDDVRLPFSTVDPVMGDLFSVLWEPEMLQSMGQTINILATEVLTQSIQQILGATVLTGLMASLQLPMILSKLGYLLDNPWNVSLDRAWSSGLILADSLINRNLGVRPVTLVGFSLGARVIISCLVELARRGAYGLVEEVYIFGSPVVVRPDQFSQARSVVSGRFVNGYSRKDWVLGYLFRATSGGLGRVAGLAAVENVPDVENFDNTDIIEGHMGYRKSIPKLLRLAGFEVISDDFVEIEDPDPDKLRERQRELKHELETARKDMEAEAAKEASQKQRNKFFSWLRPKKKEWWEMTEGGKEMGSAEVRDDRSSREVSQEPSREQTPEPSTSGASGASDDVMFDVEAIQREINKIDTKPDMDKEATVPLEPVEPVNLPQTKATKAKADPRISRIEEQKEQEEEQADDPAAHQPAIVMTFDDDAFDNDD